MTSNPTWLSHFLNSGLVTEEPETAYLWLSNVKSPLHPTGSTTAISGSDAAEIYKKRFMKAEGEHDWWIDALRAPRQCPKAGCRETQPCPQHPQGWANKDPSIPDLPGNWEQLKKMVPKTGGCESILD